MSIEKEDKLGEGAYGIVYKGTMTEEDKITKVAIKRNYGDPENKGSSCLREMSFLALFHHPCITKLKNISVGDPFAKKCPMTPKPRRQEMVEDSHHFVMEFSDGDLADYYDNCSDYYDLKIVMCQILLGLEFIHSKGVLHRDLKPGNILVSMGEDKLPYAKICDFGLACHPSNYRPSTPGTVTYWYRAPEICCEYEHYSFPSDIWSMACIFYEIVKKKPLIITKDDNSKKVFKDIVNKVPHEMTATLINDFISKGDCGRFKHGFKSSNQRPTFEDYLESVDEEDFNDSGGGTKEEFICLLKKMMSIDPSKRPTATECLEDDFFEVFKDYKDNMYKEFPPRQEEIKTVKIIPCLERAWAVNILIKIYNQRQDIKWYNDHIIFHALRLYDDYLVYQYKNSKLRAKSAKGIGRLHTEHENSLRVYSCVYMMYKYFSTLYRIYTWDKIFPRFLAVEKNVQTIENFEKFYLKNICNYKLYGPTIIEYLDMNYKEKSGVMKDLDIMKYFINYGSIDVKYEGTMEDLYLQIREGFKN